MCYSHSYLTLFFASIDVHWHDIHVRSSRLFFLHIQFFIQILFFLPIIKKILCHIIKGEKKSCHTWKRKKKLFFSVHWNSISSWNNWYLCLEAFVYVYINQLLLLYYKLRVWALKMPFFELAFWLWRRTTTTIQSETRWESYYCYSFFLYIQENNKIYNIIKYLSLNIFSHIYRQLSCVCVCIYFYKS